MASTFTRGHSFSARLYDAICSIDERRGLREWRKVLVGDLTGSIVELGCGTGLNFPHYGPDATVFASDYDPVMLARAIPRAVESPAKIHVFVADAMKLPLADDSVDSVVIGLMLCTVPDPQRALSEVRRVLRTGGKLRFVEHVRDAEGTMRARVQDAINPVWRFVSGGCNDNRRTQESVEASGFELVRLEPFKLGRSHVAPHIFGEAVVQ